MIQYYVETFHQVSELPASVLSLFENKELGFDLTYDWFLTLSQHSFDEDNKNILYVVYKSNGTKNEPILIMPMRYLIPKYYRPNTIFAMTNYYTSYYSIVTKEWDISVVREALGLIVKKLISDSPPWDVINISPLDNDSVLYNELISSIKSSGLMLHEYFRFGNWYLETQGRDYSQYEKTLPKQVRNTIKRKTRVLERGFQSRFCIYTGVEEMQEAIEHYHRVYSQSWKKSEPYLNFIIEMVKSFADRGWIRLGVLYLEGQPAASQIWIVKNSVASIYKLAHVEAYKKYSVGTLLTRHLLEHVMDIDKVRTIDFLTGDDAYKKQWMFSRRERWGIIAFNRTTIKGLLLATRHMFPAMIKRKIFPSKAIKEAAPWLKKKY